jgi:hypothetical protein
MTSHYTERDRRVDSENVSPACFLIGFSLRYAIGVGELEHGLTREGPSQPRRPTTTSRFRSGKPPSLLRGGVLDSPDLAVGFDFGGERIPLINPQRGIFKPRQMAGLLSIRTVFPRQGGRVWYEDQREAHRQIYAGDEVVDYAFMGTDPNSPDNRWLRMRWSSRSRSSISSALRPADISRSFRHSL